MLFQKIESSNLSAIGYDEVSRTLGVLFQANSLYFYVGVPKKTWDAFTKAESFGKHYNVEIKTRYESFKVENLKPVDGSALVVLEPIVAASSADLASEPSLADVV